MYYNALMGREQTSADIEDIDTSNYEKLKVIKQSTVQGLSHNLCKVG